MDEQNLINDHHKVFDEQICLLLNLSLKLCYY